MLVVGFSDILLFENYVLNEFSWVDVVFGVGMVVFDGYFIILLNIFLYGFYGDFISDFIELSVVKYWLVGVYNIYFDDSSISY